MKRLVRHSLDSGSAGTGNTGGSSEAAGFLFLLTQLWQGVRWGLQLVLGSVVELCPSDMTRLVPS